MDKTKTMQVVTFYLLTHLGLIFFMYPTDVIESVEVGHWVPILTGFAAHVLLLMIFVKGLSDFRSKGVIEIFLEAGKTFAFLLLLPIAIYFISLATITVRAYSEIVILFFLPNTPLWAIAILLLAVPTFISMLGVETIFRTGVLAALVFLPLLLMVLILSFQNVDWRYIFPLLDARTASLSFIVGRPYLLSLFAFTGGFLFLGFIPPYIAYNGRSVVRASAALLPVFLLSVYVPILTFGQNTALQFQFPFIGAVDTVNVGWLMFERITMFFLISLFCFAMLFLSMILWKSTRLIRSALPSIRFDAAALALSLAIFVLCLQIQDWKAVERLFWWNTILRLYAMIVIPVVTLILGMRHRRTEGSGA